MLEIGKWFLGVTSVNVIKKTYFVINYLTNINNNIKIHQLYLEDFIQNN